MNIKNIGLALFLFWFVSPIVSAGEPTNLSRYIGSTYPPLEPGLREVSGTIIGHPIEGLTYSVAWISKGQEQMLWLTSTPSDGKKGEIIWTILDAFTLPKYKPGETLVIGFCTLNNESDPEILALVKYEEDQEVFRHVTKAWRANRGTKKFETIKSNGISCANESYGK